MFSERNTAAREKKFLAPGQDDSRQGLRSTSTLTDDHALFLLNQQRERRTKIEKRSWYSRFFRRR